MALPINAIINDIVAQFPAARLVIQAPPGAGKSTQLPLELLAVPQSGKILMLQPRRLAAINIAHFLAARLGESVGDTVGYAIRGEHKQSDQTRLLIVTEGVLVRWLQQDPELKGINTVIFDEFHERNIASDLGLALLLDTLTLREDLSLLLMSATLPAEPIQQWLQQALGESVTVLKSEGRQYPLTLRYRPPGRQPWLQRVVAVIHEAAQHAAQGILVFVPGVREINWVINQLNDSLPVPCLPLHGQLPLHAQRQALTFNGERRVIVATNVAETSLTIDGIDCVVDSGRERVSLYRPQYAASQLVTRYISLASAAQRAGRAGRQGPGTAYRIWSESDEHGFNAFADADVATQDLTQLVAEVTAWGASVDSLHWLTPPSKAHTQHAYQVLQQLTVVTKNRQLTEAGALAMSMGADIRLARIAAAVMNQPEAERYAVVVALATLEEPVSAHVAPCFSTSVKQHLEHCSVRSRWYQRYQFWLQLLDCKHSLETNDESLAKWLLYGFPEYVAQRVDEQVVKLSSGVRLRAAEVNSEWLLALDVRLSETAEGHRATSLLPVSIAVLGAHPAIDVEQTEWVDIAAGRSAVLYRERRVASLVLERTRMSEKPDQQKIHQGLVNWIAQQGINALHWSPVALSYWHRLNYFYRQWPDAHEWFTVALPTTASLTENLEHWALPFWTSVEGLNDLKKWDPLPGLKQCLDYEHQQSFNRLCPTSWTAPSGRHVTIEYPDLNEAEQGIKPRVTLKLQEVFGEPASPMILAGKQTLVMDLLSPAGRLLQRTEDLASFWKTGYPEVCKAMRGRYPKHPWPDDPIHAQATLKTNRQLR